MYGWSDGANLLHQFRELIGIERLHAIGKRALRVGMDFDEQAVRARRNCRSRHGRHFIAASSTVRGIGHHRQVRKALDHRNRGDVERVA